MMFGRHIKTATVPVKNRTCALASSGLNAYPSTPLSNKRLTGANSTAGIISGEQQRSDFSRRLN